MNMNVVCPVMITKVVCQFAGSKQERAVFFFLVNIIYALWLIGGTQPMPHRQLLIICPARCDPITAAWAECRYTK